MDDSLALLVVFVPCAVIAIVWSIVRGVRYLRQTYDLGSEHQAEQILAWNLIEPEITEHQQAKRILAWNLIEPGITIPNVALWYIFGQGAYPAFILWGSPHTVDLARVVLGLVECFWPMVVVFVMLPAVYQLSHDPTIRRAARNTAMLGIPRLIVTVITYCTLGMGMMVGIPLLFWSIYKIRIWTIELGGARVKLGGAPAALTGLGIGKGPDGMWVVPNATGSVKVLLRRDDDEITQPLDRHTWSSMRVRRDDDEITQPLDFI